MAAGKPSGRPRVYVDASLISGLVVAPVPNYPKIAVREGWGGLGVFELRFRRDGSVKEVTTLLTTEHQLLDETARASLAKWRCRPGSLSSGRLTISFSSHHDASVQKPLSRGAMANLLVHPMPTYPFAARLNRWEGAGLFVMRFREDGSVEKVVALRPSGNVVLDEECVRTLGKWRCRPGVYVSAYIPVNFTMSE